VTKKGGREPPFFLAWKWALRSERHPDDPRALLLVAPGWVRTEMGGEQAALEISDSIALVVDVIERNAGVPGLRFTDRHGEILAW
jgi:hypothetical protein